MKKKNSNKYDKKFDRQNFYDNEKSDRINNDLRKNNENVNSRESRDTASGNQRTSRPLGDGLGPFPSSIITTIVIIVIIIVIIIIIAVIISVIIIITIIKWEPKDLLAMALVRSIIHYKSMFIHIKFPNFNSLSSPLFHHHHHHVKQINQQCFCFE